MLENALLCGCIIKQFALKKPSTKVEECRNTQGMLVNNVQKNLDIQ